MGDRPLGRLKLLKLLRRFGVTEHTRRGTSHRSLQREVSAGVVLQYTLSFHGDNETIRPSVIKAIRTQFELLPEDGVSDRDFYRK